MSHPKVLAYILAGGKGERLFPLTYFRSKPSVPFGGRYRIVDFVLSNMINSHIFSIYLLVQYKSQSLIEHIRRNWVLTSMIRDHFVAVVPPQMRMGPEWFQGTADAVYQNINLAKDNDAALIVVFGADHVYRMDVRQMIDFHLAKNADVSVAARPVPIAQASAFGVIVTDDENRIIGFQEKPKKPTPMPGDPTRAYVSMGNYIFSRDVLMHSLATAQRKKQHDFGAHILPSLVHTRKAFAYDFALNVVPGTQPFEEQGYWRDVGTIAAFYEAHMDMLGEQPNFDLDNNLWPIYPAASQSPAAKFISADIRNSVIAEGASIKKAKIRNSVLRSNVTVEEGAVIEDSIVMDNVTIRKNAKIKRVIIDKHNLIDADSRIGHDPEKDRFRCHVDTSGIAIIPRGGMMKKPAKR